MLTFDRVTSGRSDRIAVAVDHLIIAGWAVVTGILEIIVAIVLRRELRGEWMLALTGVLSVALGVVLALQPTAGAIAVVWIIGAYAILLGTVLIFLGFRVRRAYRALDRLS